MQLTIGIGLNISLHRIAFCLCQLGSADFKVLTDALRDHKTLKEVKISESTMMVYKVEIQALIQCNQSISFDVRLY